MVKATKETLVPALLASVLGQHSKLFVLDPFKMLNADRQYGSFGTTLGRIRRLCSTGSCHYPQPHAPRFVVPKLIASDLPSSPRPKATENGLMAKLTLHNVHGRLRADMFLSSLAESSESCLPSIDKYLRQSLHAAIALPMGMSGDKLLSLSPSTQDILTALDSAERLFWADLALIARRGNVSDVRDAAVSLALIRALQTSLGKAGKEGPVLTARLLGSCLQQRWIPSIDNAF